MTCTATPYRPELNIEIACEIAGIPVGDAKRKNHNRGISYRRFHVMAIMRSWGRSLPQIAMILGGINHTSVLHGIRRWEEIKDRPLPPLRRVAHPRPPKPLQRMVYWSAYRCAWDVRISRTNGGFVGSFTDYDEAVAARDAALSAIKTSEAA